ncbi:MAG TPA: ABC transporter permease [Candidatus Methylomirabilis sp.]|nr:ABC transporter permease [Candidatus Methylomirabilis sp.]
MRGRAAWRAVTLGLFLVFMLVPLLATVLFSVSTRWDRTIWPEGLTLRWWQAVTARSAFQTTLMHSLTVAAATVAVSVALVTPTAYWAHLRAQRARPWIEFLAIVPFGLPGVVLALGLIRFYSGVPLPLINTPAILVAAYVVLTLPFMYRPLVNALEAVDARTLTEAAQSLGAGSWQTLVRAILPNILPGVVNGGLLVFSTVFAEFTLANLLTGTSFKTFPIYLVEFTRFDARQASALAVISFVVAWLASVLLIWLVGREDRPRETLAAR